QPLRKRPLLNRFQVLARQSNVQPPVLAERGLRVTGVPRVFALAALRGLPFAALDGVKQLLLVSVHLHRRTPRPNTASSVPKRSPRTISRQPTPTKFPIKNGPEIVNFRPVL